MSISEKDIRHLAELARIHLTDEEILQFKKELPSILDFVATLQSADTGESEAVIGGTNAVNVAREDAASIPALGDPLELKTAFLKSDERGGLIVPKILECCF